MKKKSPFIPKNDSPVKIPSLDQDEDDDEEQGSGLSPIGGYGFGYRMESDVPLNGGHVPTTRSSSPPPPPADVEVPPPSSPLPSTSQPIAVIKTPRPTRKSARQATKSRTAQPKKPRPSRPAPPTARELDAYESLITCPSSPLSALSSVPDTDAQSDAESELTELPTSPDYHTMDLPMSEPLQEPPVSSELSMDPETFMEEQNAFDDAGDRTVHYEVAVEIEGVRDSSNELLIDRGLETNKPPARVDDETRKDALTEHLVSEAPAEDVQALVTGEHEFPISTEQVSDGSALVEDTAVPITQLTLFQVPVPTEIPPAGEAQLSEDASAPVQEPTSGPLTVSDLTMGEPVDTPVEQQLPVEEQPSVEQLQSAEQQSSAVEQLQQPSIEPVLETPLNLPNVKSPAELQDDTMQVDTELSTSSPGENPPPAPIQSKSTSTPTELTSTPAESTSNPANLASTPVEFTSTPAEPAPPQPEPASTSKSRIVKRKAPGLPPMATSRTTRSTSRQVTSEAGPSSGAATTSALPAAKSALPAPTTRGTATSAIPKPTTTRKAAAGTAVRTATMTKVGGKAALTGKKVPAVGKKAPAAGKNGVAENKAISAGKKAAEPKAGPSTKKDTPTEMKSASTEPQPAPPTSPKKKPVLGSSISSKVLAAGPSSAPSSPLKLVRSTSMFVKPVSTHVPTSSNYKALDSMLHKLKEGPPTRPNTSMGFNRNGPGDDSDEEEEGEKRPYLFMDDSQVAGPSSRPLHKRASTTGSTMSGSAKSTPSSSAAKSSIPGVSSKSTAKPAFPSKPAAPGAQSRMTFGINSKLGASAKPGTSAFGQRPARGGAAVRGRMLPPSNAFPRTRVSRNPTLPSVEASPVKGSGGADDDDVMIVDEQPLPSLFNSLGASASSEDIEMLEPSNNKGKGKASDVNTFAEKPGLPRLRSSGRTRSSTSQQGYKSAAPSPPGSGSAGPVADARPGASALKGCTILVDVTSADNENLHDHFAGMLTGMGARITRTVGTRCTHIVFKNGSHTTVKLYRAMKDSTPLVVGIDWVAQCTEKQNRVEETPYLVDLSEVNISAPKSKRKSMIPVQFSSFDDITNPMNNGGADRSMDESVHSVDDDLPPLERARRRLSTLPTRA